MSSSLSNPLFDFLVWSYNSAKEINSEVVVDFIVHAPQIYAAWWKNLLKYAPEHLVIETALCLFIVWLIFIRKTVDPAKSSKADKLTAKEVEWLLDTWQPDPLVPELTAKEEQLANSMLVIESVTGNMMKIKGVKKPVMNVASFDFLGMSIDENIKQVARKALDFYGCGSCGPRGFYGTIDQHIIFEQAIAAFMGAQEAISYSDGASAVSSAIPAFSKKGDLLLVDDACSEPILTGLNLSRSTVQFFRHNDVEHLREILESIAYDDRRFKRDTSQQRRFIVVEGLYRNTGDLCPLPEILTLKEKYFYRLILDESLSFGSVGRTGRGVTEFYGVKTTDVEVITLAMDTALASVGGVCIGSREVVDHQRLSGAGYCFSASAPPFLSATATAALQRMEREPELLEALHIKSKTLHKSLSELEVLQLRSSVAMPVMHLSLRDPLDSFEAEVNMIMAISNACVNRGVGIMPCKFSLLNQSETLRPSLMVCVSTKLTGKDLSRIVTVLQQAIKASFK